MEDRVIEDVEHLQAELEESLLGEAEALQHGRIPLVDAIHAQGGDSRDGHHVEGADVERRGAWVGHAIIENQWCAEVDVIAGAGAAAVGPLERRAGLVGVNRVENPSTGHGVHPTLPQVEKAAIADGQLVGEGGHEAVGVIDHRYTFLGGWIGRVQPGGLLDQPGVNVVEGARPHDLGGRARLCHAAGGVLEQIQFLLGRRVRPNHRTLLQVQAGSQQISRRRNPPWPEFPRPERMSRFPPILRVTQRSQFASMSGITGDANMSCNNIESAPAGSALSRPVVKRTRKMRIQLHFLSAFAASILGPLTASAQGPTVYRVSTFAGSVSTPTSDTDALSLTLNTAFGLARDSQGNFYIADYGNHRIRKVTAAGRASVIAGTGAQGFTGNNGPATSAQLTYPRSIALDGDKYLYISEPIINRIRRIDLSTGIITLVVGDGVSRYNGDGAVGTSTSISEVLGMAVDGQGSLFIADSGSHRIRKLSSKDGTMSTIAGTGAVGRTDAGIATDAPISRPTGMAIGINGDLYFSDIGNGIIQRIRAGVISTVAGSTASTARTSSEERV